ncbi:hypothetical protein CYJ59_05555 [Gardnerella leopoldii]|uniref:Uncharacterized protein n=2 Tax=Gardnerella TaxID=2701 RepID=A0AAP8ITI8_GARVA|nr:hypothetical protein CYJ60_05550 [Gardnerella vaginalis]PKZ19857.1 hypothetical protein CYJ59_05555 [Gardnerella vaginalis]PKZ59866.1 hypothetical protein CYJ61_00170 [Gardnerella vaginalis]
MRGVSWGNGDFATFCGATACLSVALRARKQLGAPSLLKVESPVDFQRKRGLLESVKTKAR